MSWYTDGSINVEQNSKKIIGVNTKWTNPLIGICSGQMLILKTQNTIEIHEITSVQSDTELTLANPYTGGTKSGLKYEIPTVPKLSIESLALRISEMLNYYQQQMEGWQTLLTGEGEVTLTAPDGRVIKLRSQHSIQQELSNFIKKNGNEKQSINGHLDVSLLTENGNRVFSLNNSDIVGAFRLMPFRANELPFGWYVRNGDNYLLNSPQGQALNKLSDNYKRDHQITIKNINGQQHINTPTAFTSDGRGFFERAVNGEIRQVGDIEDDAIRNLYGDMHHLFHWRGTIPNGVFRIFQHDGGSGLNNRNYPLICSGPESDFPEQKVVLDASWFVPTANENRPINMGLTPVIYLGV